MGRGTKLVHGLGLVPGTESYENLPLVPRHETVVSRTHMHQTRTSRSNIVSYAPYICYISGSSCVYEKIRAYSSSFSAVELLDMVLHIQILKGQGCL